MSFKTLFLINLYLTIKIKRKCLKTNINMKNDEDRLKRAHEILESYNKIYEKVKEIVNRYSYYLKEK